MRKEDTDEILKLRTKIKEKLQEIDELVGKINAIVYAYRIRGDER